MNYLSYSALCIILITACIADIKTRVIPDRLIVPGAVTGLIMTFFNPEVTLLDAGLGFFTAGVILWLISIVTKGGIGMGDAKLLACTGMFLGLEKMLSALAVAFVVSGLAGLALLVSRFSRPGSSMPFSPFILIGVVLAILSEKIGL